MGFCRGHVLHHSHLLSVIGALNWPVKEDKWHIEYWTPIISSYQNCIWVKSIYSTTHKIFQMRRGGCVFLSCCWRWGIPGQCELSLNQFGSGYRTEALSSMIVCYYNSLFTSEQLLWCSFSLFCNLFPISST